MSLLEDVKNILDAELPESWKECLVVDLVARYWLEAINESPDGRVMRLSSSCGPARTPKEEYLLVQVDDGEVVCVTKE